MKYRSHILRSIFLLVLATCLSASGETSLENTYPDSEKTPATGTINRTVPETEEATAEFSDLPTQPTKEALERIELEGLVLRALPDKEVHDGSEEEALAVVLKEFAAREDAVDGSALEKYIEKYPEGSWTAGLRVTHGKLLYMQGRFSEALAEFETAWAALKDAEEVKLKEAAMSAAAELAGLYARLGMMEELEAVLVAVRDWPICGPDTERIRMAAQGLDSMKTMPEHSFKCGPYALANIRTALGLEPAMHTCIAEKASTPQGISLAELVDMATEMKMDWVAATRGEGAELPVPALVHWKLGHYAAVIERMDDGRLLVRDPTFMHDFLITPEVFARESSSHFLIPRSALGKGWEELDEKRAADVYGKGAPAGQDQDDSSDKCPKTKNCGMAGYDFDFYKAGLLISDVPLAYQPHYGPAIEIQLSYRQRGLQILDATAYGFGSKWTSNWSSYIQQTDATGNNFAVFLPGGEKETHSLGPGVIQKRSYRELINTAHWGRYVLIETDGSSRVYSRKVLSASFPKFFLTSVVDKHGYSVNLTYDSSNRLTGITDALGQTTNLYYENVSADFDQLVAYEDLVTKISDPFTSVGGQRRSAQFKYDRKGRLEKIIDAAGIESSFSYHATQTDFIDQLTTPYGTTTFTTNESTLPYPQFVVATDPLLRKERVEYRNSFSDWLPKTDPPEELPDTSKINVDNDFLYYGNTLYWDKKSYAHHKPDPVTGANYDKAEQTKWMWNQYGSMVTAVIASVKKPNEARIWYEYAGQYPSPAPNPIPPGSGQHLGPTEKLIKIGRRVSATETAVTTFETDDFGNTTKVTDPLGRVTEWQYHYNGRDLLFVKQRNGANIQTLAAYTYYYPPYDPHRIRMPLLQTVTDAAGQTTTLTWNARDQLDSITQPGSLVTDLVYTETGTHKGFLEAVDGPLAGISDRTTFTPDLYGRVRTTTSPGAYTLTFDYDALNRPTLVTYPDSTTEQFSYQRANGQKILDLTHFKDREGRWTLFGYDALRQRTASIDPLGRVTRFHWCYCGALQDLWDAEGNKTHWDYDFTGRLTKKTYADGKETSYTYQPLTGWLDTVTDARSQVKTHSYFLDGNLQGIAYTNSAIATPNVSFTYDAVYGRLATMTDGTGTTTYAYHPVDGSTFGAGNLHTIDGPLGNDTIAHTYDSLGRMKTQSINGAANTTTINTYDALSRVTQFTNPLGVFNQTYDPVNLMPKLTTAPNGLTTELFYEPALGDLRLQEIRHKVGATNLSAHVYGYQKAGNIKSWAQTTGTSPAKTWAVSYDKADQLEAASRTESGAVIAQQAFRFDQIGNITSKQNGAEISKSTHNNRNQIVSEQPGGWMRVRGVTNESSSVRVKSNANPFTNAQTDKDKGFFGWVETVPGQNTLTIEATDDSPNANKKTSSYTVNVTGQSRVPSYDFNGNMTNNGTGQTYLWDAENRLVKITYADGSSTSFSYDGISRRTRITERNTSNAITSDKRYVWSGGNQPAEERDATTNAVTKRFFEVGEQRIGGADAGLYYYATDHLGSVREVTNSSGTLVARYDFDLWGKRTKLTGTLDTEVGFTGHHHHAKSGLVLTWFRAYDAEAGRWLSADPLGEGGGLNLYAYCYGNPLNLYDPDGMRPQWMLTNEEIGDALNDGFFATLDGAIPFADPFQDRGHYGKCESGVGASQALGGVARDVGLAAATGGVAFARGGASRILAGGTGRGGIYEITTTAGRYVGETHKFTSRFKNGLGIHNSKGVVQTIKRWAVRGDKSAVTTRQIAEQARIDKLGGIKNLLNKLNPIGPKRKHLMNGYSTADSAAAHGLAGAGVVHGLDAATGTGGCK
jgi:RHS repeat-associated protein